MNNESQVNSNYFQSQFRHNFTTPVVDFIRMQRRMITSALGFPAKSLNDLEESILLVSILSHCAKDSNLYLNMLGDLAMEFDSFMFALMCEYSQYDVFVRNQENSDEPSLENYGMLKDKSEFLANSQQNECNLRLIDCYRITLLKHVISYCRKRNPLVAALKLESQIKEEEKLKTGSENTFLGKDSKSIEREKRTYTVASDINALILCIRETSKALVIIQRKQQKLTVLKDTYFIFEGALSVLYVKLRELYALGDIARIRQVLCHKNLLANYYNKNCQASSLEELEESLKATNQSRYKFIHVMLRNMRELIQ